MSRCIAHRGPDGDGLWRSPSGAAVLAHRRLSVIDLAAGAQPMVRGDSTLGLVFNGEIYNYVELQAELRARDVPLQTDSDTEVLLQTIAREGEAGLAVLRGMFAFAAWDDTRRHFLAARDRIGKKPFYYVVEGGCLYFASSLAALAETAPTRYEIDVAAIDQYLSLGYIPAPATVYRQVRKLRAGSCLRIENGQPVERPFWDLAEDAAPFSGTFDDALDRLDEILTASVTMRLRSDVPLGVFLSGGIDSSLVTALAARHATAGVVTFSVGMDVAAFDESGHAAEVARRLGTEHHLFRVSPDLLATLPAMVRHYGEPFADSSALPTWLLSQHTRQHVTVALGGDGGDEGFAGYDWYRTAAALQRFNRYVPERVFAAAGGALGGLHRARVPLPRAAGRLRRGLQMLGVPHGAERFAAMRTFLGPSDADALYAGDLAASRRERGDAARRMLEERYRRAQGSDVRRMRYVDIGSYLADCLMVKVDVASMAHALEVRAPLLDQEVVRFALSLPDAYLFDEVGGKRPLRALLARHLPRELFERPKQGFSIPMRRWIVDAARDRMERLTRSERLLDTGWFRPQGIRDLLDEHVAGLRDNSHRLYALLFLDEWLAAAR